MFVPVHVNQCVKYQYLILLNDIVPKNRENVLAFKRFSDRLDTIYAGLLVERGRERECVCVCVCAFEVVFCLFHRLSAMERGFNADALFTVENQSELSLKT